MDQSHGPYISWCSHQKHHNLPCFGSSKSSVAPSSGEFQISDMASKQPKIIEVPDDDDFPDSGPQNPVEAQSYRDKRNAIMDTFSDLLADDCKDTLRSTVTSLKKLMVKHWWQMAEADVDVVLKSIHNPSCIYLHQHLTTKGVDVTEPATEVPEGWTFLRQLPEKVWKTEVWELIVTCFDHLVICGQHVILGQDHQSRDLRHGHEGGCLTNDSDQCPRALPESSPRSTPEDNHRRMPVPARESPAPPTVVSCMGTMVQTHPASSCSSLAPSQMQIFQWQHHQGGLHYV